METDTQRMTVLYFQKILLLQRVAEEFPPSYVVKFRLIRSESVSEYNRNMQSLDRIERINSIIVRFAGKKPAYGGTSVFRRSIS